MPPPRRRRGGGDEKGVGPGDQRACALVQPGESLDPRNDTLPPQQIIPALDILRAIAEALIHGDREAAGIGGDDMAVHAIAPARPELDAQQADRRAGLQRRQKRIARDGARGDVEAAGIGAGDEARRPRQQRGRGHPLGVDRAQDHEGKLGKEIAMLLGHEIAEDRPADPVHLFPTETHTGLESALARMPRSRGQVPVGETAHFKPRFA